MKLVKFQPLTLLRPNQLPGAGEGALFKCTAGVLEIMPLCFQVVLDKVSLLARLPSFCTGGDSQEDARNDEFCPCARFLAGSSLESVVFSCGTYFLLAIPGETSHFRVVLQITSDTGPEVESCKVEGANCYCCARHPAEIAPPHPLQAVDPVDAQGPCFKGMANKMHMNSSWSALEYCVGMPAGRSGIKDE